MDIVTTFGALFQGRLDVYGTEDGGCVRPKYDDAVSHWHHKIRQHLWDDPPMGVYPIVELDGCWVSRWGCVDFDLGATHAVGFPDEESCHGAACDVAAVLAYFDIYAHIERTRSRGRHVWVFFDDWIDARTIRRALLAACDIAEQPGREVNPKSAQLRPGQIGNYVRLPYPHRRGRTMLTEGGEIVALEEFLADATAHRATCADLAELSALWTAPTPAAEDTRCATPINGQLSAITDKLGGLSWTIYSDGPLDGSDRSGTLVRLARKAWEDGLTADEVLTVVISADERWGKFYQRADGLERLQEIVEKARPR